MRVLGVGAHPDDIECSCAGTLAKYARRGDQVFAALTTNGELGSVVIPPDELVVIREREARQAAEIYGAQLWWMGEPDGDLWVEPRTLALMEEVFEWAQPDVVFTHVPEDYHSDHRATSELVRAVWGRRVRADGSGPVLVYIGVETSVDYLPNVYVDITETLEAKLGALACHRSQLDWIEAHDGRDLLAWQRERAHSRGLQCGAEYAECFVLAGIGGRGRAGLMP